MRVGRARDSKTEALVEANAHIAEVAADASTGETVWQFFCECGARDCRSAVDLSFDAYVAIRDGCGAVLAPGHSVNQSARAARLRQEARALRAQAELQVRRARKNAP